MTQVFKCVKVLDILIYYCPGRYEGLGASFIGQIGPETVTDQSGEAMAQLHMWQLKVGYNLCEIEVREEVKKKLAMKTGCSFGLR